MARSKWKGPFFNINLYNKIVNFKDSKQDKKSSWDYKIWNRGSVIPAILLNKRILVHTGKVFKRVFINRQKVGLKFGSLVDTKKFTFVLPKSLKSKK